MSMPEIPHPPKGTPEYEEWAAQDKAPSILISCWIIIGLATIFVIGRLVVRFRLFSKTRADDYWCLGGLVAAYASAAFTTVAVEYGNGRHFNLLTRHQQESVVFWTTVAFCPSILTFGLPKLAVISLLTRLLNPSRWHWWFLWGMGIFCLLTLFATIGTLLGQCLPPESLRNFDIKGECAPKHHIVNYSLFAGALSAFVDVYLAVYPAVVLFKLQMKLHKKLALVVALSIGCVSGAFAIYKTTRIPNGLASPDFSYDSADLIIWTLVEGCSIIIACTIPVLSPLMDMVFKRRNPFRSSRRNQYYGNMSSGGVNGTFGGTGARRTNDLETGGSSSNNSRPRRMRHLDDDNLDDTMVGGEESDSQELVMRDKTSKERLAGMMDTDTTSGWDGRGGGGGGGVVPSVPPVPLHRSRSTRASRVPARRPPEGAILRTDEVTLTFDSAESRSR